MRSSSTVLIYNAFGSSSESVSDLKELFSCEDIFSSKPDVTLSDFNCNFTGIANPTFVVPGGSAVLMGQDLRSKIKNIKAQLCNKFNYVGSCAGAFIGTNDGAMFMTDSYGSTPTFFDTTKGLNANLDFIYDYMSCGPFYPKSNIANLNCSKNYVPYSANIAFPEYGSFVLPQLYVAGPGFISLNNSKQTSDIIGVYNDEGSYTFTFTNAVKSIHNLPAMIRKKSCENEGGIFLSGVHIEASVPDSQFLKFFKTKGSTHAALREQDYQNLVDKSAQSLVTIKTLLRDTLK